MPIDPQQLLDLANRLVAPTATEAELRRGISSAYYALFHFLIQEILSNFVSDPALGTRLGRAIQHGSMKSACEKYRIKKPGKRAKGLSKAPGSVANTEFVAEAVGKVAGAFFDLHGSREKADYDAAITIQFSEASDDVQLVEQAFQAWLAISQEPLATQFLQDLFCLGVGKR